MPKLIKGVNDLKSVNPNLAQEWDFEKNGELTPESITANNNRKVWWICHSGHSWEATIGSRNKGSGCPYCAGQRPIVGVNDLATVMPELVSEWDYSENGALTPDSIMVGSGKMVAWICKYGHKWKSSVSNRAKGSGCPYCSGNKIIVGDNDLATKRPELIAEWDSEANYPITPSSIGYMSGKTVSWKCPKCSFTWKAKIANRSQGYNGCPHCNSISVTHPEIAKEWDYEANVNLSFTPDTISIGSSRKAWWRCSRCGHKLLSTINNRGQSKGCPNCNTQTSFPEQAVFYYIKSAFQDAINRYSYHNTEIDIYIPSIQVGIEYDGVFFHDDRLTHENKKDLFCMNNHIKLIRIRENGLVQTANAVNICRENNTDNADLDKCIEKIFSIIGFSRHISIDSKRDEIMIRSQYLQAVKENSFASKHPELLDEWDHQKNKGIDPYSISEYSKLEAWWKCPSCGSEWKASVSMRSRGKKKCIYCHSIEVMKPSLLDEWDYQKNGSAGITPATLTISSGKIVWWRCSKGHSWQASIANRSKGTGCPYCSGYIAIKGKTDLASLRPDLLAEWDYEGNIELGITPDNISISSGKKVWWKCSKGHKWQTIIANRTKGKNCPYCANQKVWKGYNDLVTTNPKLALEWDYDKNGDKKPNDYVQGSNLKVWWLCTKCGHSWQSSIVNRSKHHACPNCHNKYWE